MGWDSKIEWTHATFNPWWGCTEFGAECDHCYAREYARSARGLIVTRNREVWNKKGAAVRHHFGDKHWNEPAKWDRKAAAEGTRYRVFAGSMCDVMESTTAFPADVRDALWEAKRRLWALVEATPNLDWLLLTKRPHRIATPDGVPRRWLDGAWPSNAWLGVTAGNQRGLTRVRQASAFRDLVPRLFVSHEPAIGPIAWDRGVLRRVDWLITGGESGPQARPMHPRWVRDARNAALVAGARWHFKQWGDWMPMPEGGGTHYLALDGRYEPRLGRTPEEVFPDGEDVIQVRKVGKQTAGRIFDGATWDQIPEAA